MYVISDDDDDDDDDDGSGAESQYKVTSHLAPSRTFAQLNKEDLSTVKENIPVQDNVTSSIPVQSSKEDLTVKKEHCPVLERPVKGYTAERLLDIIVGNQVRTASICQRVPRAVRKHAAYVVDTVALGCSDILSYGDDNGSWGGHTKPRRKYKIEVSEQLGITSMRKYHSNDKGTPDPEGVYTLYRNYFQHAHTPEFRKVIATVNDWEGNMLPLAVVQYFFEGGIEVPIKLAKHGNDQRVDAEPFMRTSRPLLKKKNPRKMHDHIMQESCG